MPKDAACACESLPDGYFLILKRGTCHGKATPWGRACKLNIRQFSRVRAGGPLPDHGARIASRQGMPIRGTSEDDQVVPVDELGLGDVAQHRLDLGSGLA